MLEDLWPPDEISARVAVAPVAPPTLRLRLLALLIVVLGGTLGILGAGLQELRSGGGILVAFAGAPIIEEALKPAGIYILLIRWPQALGGRLQTALFAALAGVCFGLVESAVFTLVYFPDEGSDFVLFRFTVPVAMHALFSFTVGLGLSRGIIDWAAGRSKLPRATRNFYIAGVLMHATYNIGASILALAGFLDFE